MTFSVKEEEEGEEEKVQETMDEETMYGPTKGGGEDEIIFYEPANTPEAFVEDDMHVQEVPPSSSPPRSEGVMDPGNDENLGDIAMVDLSRRNDGGNNDHGEEPESMAINEGEEPESMAANNGQEPEFMAAGGDIEDGAAGLSGRTNVSEVEDHHNDEDGPTELLVDNRARRLFTTNTILLVVLIGLVVSFGTYLVVFDDDDNGTSSRDGSSEILFTNSTDATGKELAVFPQALVDLVKGVVSLPEPGADNFTLLAAPPDMLRSTFGKCSRIVTRIPSWALPPWKGECVIPVTDTRLKRDIGKLPVEGGGGPGPMCRGLTRKRTPLPARVILAERRMAFTPTGALRPTNLIPPTIWTTMAGKGPWICP